MGLWHWDAALLAAEARPDLAAIRAARLGRQGAHLVPADLVAWAARLEPQVRPVLRERRVLRERLEPLVRSVLREGRVPLVRSVLREGRVLRVRSVLREGRVLRAMAVRGSAAQREGPVRGSGGPRSPVHRQQER